MDRMLGYHAVSLKSKETELVQGVMSLLCIRLCPLIQNGLAKVTWRLISAEKKKRK